MRGWRALGLGDLEGLWLSPFAGLTGGIVTGGKSGKDQMHDRLACKMHIFHELPSRQL